MYLITIILLLVIVVLVSKIISLQTKLRNVIPSTGVRIEDCPPGKYPVLGRIAINKEELEIPSGLREHYTLVYPYGNESGMFLLKSDEPPAESAEGFITILKPFL